VALSATAVREVLAQEGFAPLPRRLDEERPARLCPTTEPVADVRSFALDSREISTRVGGLFLFIAAMMWLLRSIAQSLSANEAHSACPAGIMLEPGSLALSARGPRRPCSTQRRLPRDARRLGGALLEYSSLGQIVY
jgi:hypothetical protein